MKKVVSFRKETGNSNHNMCWFTLDIREKHVNLSFFLRLNCVFFLSRKIGNYFVHPLFSFIILN